MSHSCATFDQKKVVGHSYFFFLHGPVILPDILKVFDGLMSYFQKMSWCNTAFDLKIHLGHSSPVIFSFIFCSEKHFSFIGKAQLGRTTLSCDSSYCFCSV